MFIETIVINHLRDLGFPAFAEEPDKANRPERYYLVEKTSGSETIGLQNANIAVQSYAPSLVECMGLNYAAIEKMRTLTENVQVTRCRLVTNYNYTETGTRRYRYQALFSISYYDK